MNEKIDIIIEEDLISGCQDLIQLEQHAFGSFVTSNEDKWLKILNEARKIRTKWLEKIFKEDKNRSQKWCSQKHLLSASTRLQECGTKWLEIGDVELAKEAFKDSGDLLGMFYYLNEESPQETGGFIENIKKGFKILKGGEDG